MFPISLPTELVLLILSNLPIASIRALVLANREWSNFINLNRTTIYRNAAFIEGYMEDETMVDELAANPLGSRGKSILYSQSSMKDVHEWRDFCKRRRLIERSWAGRAGSDVVPSPRFTVDPVDSPHYRRVHRIKVDENVGITIATTQIGGLVVRDLETDEVLWELPTWYVRSYAHLEYGEGYMIFDRDDGDKEIWRRTVEISPQGDDEEQPMSVEERSMPDQRQTHVMSYINRLSYNNRTDNTKARFTPHAVLRMPEPTRAYRFVYPTLLVASLERAYLMDVRTGGLVQMLSGIQVLTPQQDNQNNNQPVDLQGVLPVLDQNEDESEEEGESDDEVSTGEDVQQNQPVRFLGLVRYVDLSERHVFFAGRYLLRIFSRETGKCVMDIPSTRWRYGKWRWEIASRESVGQDHSDSYTKAKQEGREVVRMPTRFSLEEYSKASNIVIDQFVAVHVSSDGKHVVAMLSGSRLVIMHNFEAFLNPPVDPLSISDKPPVASTSSATPQPSQPEHRHESRKQRMARQREARASIQRAKNAKDEEIFEHTIDVQLGAPAASSSIYLAFENGRVGVVTTNAVYIVIPPPPPPFCALSSQTPGVRRNTTVDVPHLDILRIPFFSNPSWLSEVSCLMMSDTGLYLNWNPTWPPLFEIEQNAHHINQGFEDWEMVDETSALIPGSHVGGSGGFGFHAEGNDDGDDMNSEGHGGDLASDAARVAARSVQRFKDMRERLVMQWEMEYEKDLVDYEKYEDERYHLIPNGQMFVTPRHRDLIESQFSTIYRVNFVPESSNEETQ